MKSATHFFVATTAGRLEYVSSILLVYVRAAVSAAELDVVLPMCKWLSWWSAPDESTRQRWGVSDAAEEQLWLDESGAA